MGGFIMRISPTVFRMILLLILICLGIALGFSYYYGVNVDYTFEVYIFMTAASFVWVIVAFLVLFFLPRFELSKRQAWVAYHGHIAVAKIVGHYTTETEAQNGKKIIYHHNVVRTEDGLEFTIDYNPILKTDDGVVFIRYDEDTAIFDNRLMKLIYLKKINQSNLSSYITQNENYKPIPSDISGYKRTIFGKKLVFILLGIIILLNYIIPTVIILTSKPSDEAVISNTSWNQDIKTKSKSILGFELPEYDLGYSGSYYVSDSKQRLFDTNGNSGYLYPNANEFSFDFLSTTPDDDKLSSYATYLSNNYGFTKNYDLTNLEYYSDVASACSETNFTGYFHYIQLKKGNVYIVITKSFRNGYYAYMDYAAELKKGVWITCINM